MTEGQNFEEMMREEVGEIQILESQAEALKDVGNLPRIVEVDERKVELHYPSPAFGKLIGSKLAASARSDKSDEEHLAYVQDVMQYAVAYCARVPYELAGRLMMASKGGFVQANISKMVMEMCGVDVQQSAVGGEPVDDSPTT